MTKDVLAQCMAGWERVDEIKRLLPPGDRRAEIQKISNRIIEMICEVDGAMAQGRDVENMITRIENLIKTVLQ